MTAELPEIVLNWMEHLDHEGKSAHTLQAYRRGLRHFLDWYTGVYRDTFRPEQVMPRDVRDWQAYQQQTEGAAPATVNQRFFWLQPDGGSGPAIGHALRPLAISFISGRTSSG